MYVTGSHSGIVLAHRVDIQFPIGFRPITITCNPVQQEAVTAACATDYNIILMDMQMPEMDGMEATQIIRNRLQKQLTIIALTANTMQGDEEKCLEAGTNDYIGKPVKLEEVVAKLEK